MKTPPNPEGTAMTGPNKPFHVEQDAHGTTRTGTVGKTTSEKMVAFLNSVFQKDPCAIHALLSNSVPCNERLLYDEHVIVRDGCTDGTYLLGALGLLNGCLTAAGERPIALQWSDGQDGRPRLQGFCLFDEGGGETANPQERPHTNPIDLPKLLPWGPYEITFRTEAS